MANELLEFNAQAEFDFKMSSFAGREQKEELESDCRQAVEHAKSSFKEICLLALTLNEIKQKEQWKNVINPKTGTAFFNTTFDEFTNYAFGLSKTQTSNYLRISQFVCWHGEDRGEIEPAYKGYGYSQLVELAPVPPSHRAYFNSDMTVDQMRVAKDYVKNSAEFLDEKKKEGFDLLEKATEWKERGKTGEPAKTEQLEGQTSLFGDEETDCEDMRNPTSELASVGEEEVDIYDMPMQTHSYDTDDYDELDETQADMQADMQTIEEESERSLPPVKESPIKKYDFSTRDNIRLFLNDYENWYYRDDIRTPFTKYCYWITLPNFDILYAFEMNVATGVTLEGKQEHATEVGYFIFLQSQYYYKEMPDVFKITKRDLESYLMAHRDELNKRR